MKPRSVGIVMLAYNRADVTTLCLESLARARTDVPWQVFVLDNASRTEESAAIAGTFTRLQAEGRLPGTLHRSPTNLGFPAGNNVGLDHLLTQGVCTHVCLLNSDVVVTDFWLDRLLAHDADAVGPVTNACGNEQTIQVDALPKIGPDAIAAANAIAEQRHRRFAGCLVPTEFLGFFCCLLRLEPLTDVGMLDASFGRGAFEDDDYCLRLRTHGWKLHVARDVFVLHWGSSSFSQLSVLTLWRQIRRGRRRFERKHGVTWKSRWLLPMRGAFDDLQWLADGGRAPSRPARQIPVEPPVCLGQRLLSLVRLQWRRLTATRPSRLLHRLLLLPWVLLTRRPVLVLGRCHPPAAMPKDGYFQRVRLIDRQIAHRWRIYLCFEQPQRAGRLLPGVVHHDTRVFELHCRSRSIAHAIALLGIVLLGGRIYVHSVLRLGDGICSLLYRLARRRVFDVHGAVPEEFALHADEAGRQRFEKLERMATTRASLLIVVSRAMQRHLQDKHGTRRGAAACVPMMPHHGVASTADGAARAGVVYSGGLHRWQQLDKMLAYVHANHTARAFTFLVTEPDVVDARYHELFGTAIPAVVRSVDPSEVDACERSHAFGLVLRQDDIVNRVACPTKLVEYLHNGLVPILDSADIGDFTSLGLQYVRFDAPLPDEPTRQRMAEANAQVLRRLRAEFMLGAEQLRQHL